MRNIGRKTAMNIEKKLYQWDTEQKLTGCTGLYVDFPIGNEVYRVETADGTCIIPDELLQTSGSHKVYECMTNNTIRSFAFSVTPRPKPPDYVYTPTERLTFEGLVRRVDDAVADMIRRAESGEFDGHTPVKGTDYFTTGEIQQIQNEVSSGAIGEFKSVVDTETETFNTNAESKLITYNENDVAKTGAYNTNASNKVTEYNSNAENKTAEFDTHTEQIQADISELKSDLTDCELVNEIPLNDVETGYYITPEGTKSANDDFTITNPIPLKKNTTVKIIARGYNTNVAMISKYENGSYIPATICRSSNEDTYEYTLNEDSNIVLCYLNNSVKNCYSYVKVLDAVNSFKIDENSISAEMLDSGFSNIYDESSNKLDKNSVIDKARLGADGKITTVDNYVTTDYISCSNNKKVYIWSAISTGVQAFVISFYDKDKIFISNSAYWSKNSDIPQNAKYIRVTFTSDTFADYNPMVTFINERPTNYIDFGRSVKRLMERVNYMHLFTNVGIVGDSLSSGEVYKEDGSHTDKYQYSWLSNICRDIKAEPHHYSTGGMTTKAWVNSEYKTQLENETAEIEAYYIALGTNDKNQTAYALGNAEDVSGFDSFVGYYKQIIDIIHTKSPNAVIFCVSMYNRNHTEWSNMIKSISDSYEYCYYIDFVNNCDDRLLLSDSRIYSSWIENWHYTGIGYIEVASVIEEVTNNAIKDNLPLFRLFSANQS